MIKSTLLISRVLLLTIIFGSSLECFSQTQYLCCQGNTSNALECDNGSKSLNSLLAHSDVILDKSGGSENTVEVVWTPCSKVFDSYDVISEDEVNVRLRYRERNNFEEYRENFLDIISKIKMREEFVPNNERDSQLKIIKEINISELKQNFEISTDIINLQNKKEEVDFINCDDKLLSQVRTKLYTEYNDKKYYIDDAPKIRGDDTVEYTWVKRYETSRLYEDGIYDCKEIVKSEHYLRPDKSSFVKYLPSIIEQKLKPIKIKNVGWSHNDGSLKSTEVIQDYVITNSKKVINVGDAKSGVDRKYENVSTETNNIGDPIFQNGRLEQKIEKVETYKRPDSSVFVRRTQMPCRIVQILHGVTYQNGGWSTNYGFSFRRGTWEYIDSGRGFRVLDGDRISEYHANATMICRQALQSELKALAPTKIIPCYYREALGFGHHRWRGDSTIEVLLSANFNSVGVANGCYYLAAEHLARSMDCQKMNKDGFHSKYMK